MSGIVIKSGGRFSGPTISGRVKGFPLSGCATLLLLGDANPSISAHDEISAGAIVAHHAGSGDGSLGQPVGGGVQLVGQAKIEFPTRDLRAAWSLLAHARIMADGTQTAGNYFRGLFGIAGGRSIGFQVRAVAPFDVANTGTNVLLNLVKFDTGAQQPTGGEYYGAGGALTHGKSATFSLSHDGTGILTLAAYRNGAALFQVNSHIRKQRFITLNDATWDTTLAPMIGIEDGDTTNSDASVEVECCAVYSRALPVDDLIAFDLAASDLRTARGR